MSLIFWSGGYPCRRNGFCRSGFCVLPAPTLTGAASQLACDTRLRQLRRRQNPLSTHMGWSPNTFWLAAGFSPRYRLSRFFFAIIAAADCGFRNILSVLSSTKHEIIAVNWGCRRCRKTGQHNRNARLPLVTASRARIWKTLSNFFYSSKIQLTFQKQYTWDIFHVKHFI